MMFGVIWMGGAVIAFLALRKLALRDFGVVTVGGLIGLALLSLIVPAALLLAFALSLEGFGSGFLSRPVWTRKR